MSYIPVNTHRLSYEQCTRLTYINEYLQDKRPELEWNGRKLESRRLSDVKWKEKLAATLYSIYNDMFCDSPITRDQVTDFFDDEYVSSIMTLHNQLTHSICKFLVCC